eukprot:m.221117 g.221117  ORF g.221117 m.221117 type:complete len:118 (-) comp18716_c0_seq9:71-424(-)
MQVTLPQFALFDASAPVPAAMPTGSAQLPFRNGLRAEVGRWVKERFLLSLVDESWLNQGWLTLCNLRDDSTICLGFDDGKVEWWIGNAWLSGCVVVVLAVMLVFILAAVISSFFFCL